MYLAIISLLLFNISVNATSYCMAKLGLEKKRSFGSAISVNQLDLTKTKGHSNSLDIALDTLLSSALKPLNVQKLSEILGSGRSISISFNYKRTKDLYGKKNPYFLSKDMNVAIWLDGHPYHASLCSKKFSPCPPQVKSDFFNSLLKTNQFRLGKIIAPSFSSGRASTEESYGSFYVIKVEPQSVDYDYEGIDYKTSDLHISIAKDVTEYDTLPKEIDKQQKDDYHALQKSEIERRRWELIEGLQNNVSSIRKAGDPVFIKSVCESKPD